MSGNRHQKMSSFEDFLSATAPLEADRASEGYNIFDFLQQRRDFLLSHVDIQSRKSISVNPPERLVTKLGPKPSVTISEFLTSNRNGVQDSEGEREDWIELTNYGSQSVDLSGCFLSDRSGNPFKWSFPDGTVLAADEYLVIWADNDEKDPGLHTNFKPGPRRRGDPVHSTTHPCRQDRVWQTESRFFLWAISRTERFTNAFTADSRGTEPII